MSALLIQDFNPGSLATPSALPLFWLCVYFRVRRHFSDVGMFPWQ
jgi:hypothetical protein